MIDSAVGDVQRLNRRRAPDMDAFAWNGLRVGDSVMVHEMSVTGPAVATAGVVAFVDTKPARHGGNNVGIRLLRGIDRVVWPSRGQVEAQAT